MQLFNGKDLDGWTPKIKGDDLGDDFGNTFRANAQETMQRQMGEQIHLMALSAVANGHTELGKDHTRGTSDDHRNRAESNSKKSEKLLENHSESLPPQGTSVGNE